MDGFRKNVIVIIGCFILDCWWVICLGYKVFVFGYVLGIVVVDGCFRILLIVDEIFLSFGNVDGIIRIVGLGVRCDEMWSWFVLVECLYIGGR